MREMKDSGIEWIGEIPREWEVIKLKYFATIQSGLSIDKQNYEENGLYSIVGANGVVGKFSSFNNTRPCLTTGRVGTLGTVHKVDKAWVTDNALMIYENDTIHQDYLKYVIPYFDFNEMTSGTAMPLITATKLYNQYIPYFSLPEQRRIADFLDRKCAEIDAVIEKTKAAVEEYKKLKQSVITEAVTKGVRGPRPMKPSGVEWIGDVPEGWEKSKIKYISYFSPTCATDDLTPESEVTYTPMECIHNGYFDNQKSTFSKFSNSYTLYQEGDIVLAKVTPCFENGNISVMTNLYSNIGFGSSELFVLRPNGIETKYLFYYLQNDIFKKMACSTMTGTGGLKRVSPAFIENYFIPIPDKSEQQEISDYLDRKCAGIDNILAKKQQFIKELEAYKKSLIYEYVTGKKEVKS